MIELAGNADHQLAYEALSQLAAGGQAGAGQTIVIQGRYCLLDQRLQNSPVTRSKPVKMGSLVDSNK